MCGLSTATAVGRAITYDMFDIQIVPLQLLNIPKCTIKNAPAKIFCFDRS